MSLPSLSSLSLSLLSLLLSPPSLSRPGCVLALLMHCPVHPGCVPAVFRLCSVCVDALLWLCAQAVSRLYSGCVNALPCAPRLCSGCVNALPCAPRLCSGCVNALPCAPRLCSGCVNALPCAPRLCSGCVNALPCAPRLCPGCVNALPCAPGLCSGCVNALPCASRLCSCCVNDLPCAPRLCSGCVNDLPCAPRLCSGCVNDLPVHPGCVLAVLMTCPVHPGCVLAVLMTCPVHPGWSWRCGCQSWSSRGRCRRPQGAPRRRSGRSAFAPPSWGRSLPGGRRRASGMLSLSFSASLYLHSLSTPLHPTLCPSIHVFFLHLPFYITICILSIPLFPLYPSLYSVISPLVCPHSDHSTLNPSIDILSISLSFWNLFFFFFSQMESNNTFVSHFLLIHKYLPLAIILQQVCAIEGNYGPIYTWS